MENNILDFNPVLLSAIKYNGFLNYSDSYRKMQSRYVKDIEIDYYLASNRGGINIEGEFIEYKKGDIAVRYPGQFVYGINPYSCYFLCIDAYGRIKRSDNYNFSEYENNDNIQLTDISKKFNHPAINSLPHKINCEKTDYAGKIIESLYMENLSLNKNDLQKFKIKSLLFQLFNELLSLCSDNDKNIHNINNVLNYIHANFTDEITVEKLIENSNMSKAVFHSKFKKHTGFTPLEYIINLKIKKAQYCLLNGYSVSETANICGWFDSVYFTAVFKKHTGFTPSAYRRTFTQ